jgi:hypothetical protein
MGVEESWEMYICMYSCMHVCMYVAEAVNHSRKIFLTAKWISSETALGTIPEGYWETLAFLIISDFLLKC